MTELSKLEAAELAGETVQEALELLQRTYGIPIHVLIAGAHAAVVTMMVVELGGAMAAGSCERAAERVRDLPSEKDAPLMFAQTAGSA